MSGRFFEGFSVALLPYTILYTRARVELLPEPVYARRRNAKIQNQI
jgi:hypothetical protein